MLVSCIVFWCETGRGGEKRAGFCAGGPTVCGMGDMKVDVGEPLLEKAPPALLYPDCPGCKNSYLQHPKAKLPFRELAVLAALTLVNGNGNSLFVEARVFQPH